mgnify:CR=1 FL=1
MVMGKFYDGSWIDKLKFKDKVLNVEEAVEPELLYWQNYAVSFEERIIRNFFYIVYSLLVMIACFYGIFSLETKIQQAENSIPDIVC